MRALKGAFLVKPETKLHTLCAFSLIVVIKGHTHKDGVKSTSDHVSRLVFLFSCSKNSSINHLNFYSIKQTDNIFPCLIL